MCPCHLLCPFEFYNLKRVYPPPPPKKKQNFKMELFFNPFDNLLCILLGISFTVWFTLLLVFIIVPAIFGVSFGIRRLYMKTLLKIFEVRVFFPGWNTRMDSLSKQDVFHRVNANNLSPVPVKHPAVEQTVHRKSCWMCFSRTVFVLSLFFPTLSISTSHFFLPQNSYLTKMSYN